MAKRVALLFILPLSLTVYSQNPVKMRIAFGTGIAELDEVLRFQDIFVSSVSFEGRELFGKDYEIVIEEYADGVLKAEELFFESSESDYFKVTAHEFKIKCFFEFGSGGMQFAIRGDRFASRKQTYELFSESSLYSLQPFADDKEGIFFNPEDKLPLFGIITPSVRRDGSASYCEVMSAGVPAGELGKHFAIPHHFIVSIKFK